jgi:ferric-dicitrate binding protein FerR (iron transport regulator)
MGAMTQARGALDADDPVASTDSAAKRHARATALDRRFEIWETVLLAAATVLTAWSAFQATKWSGVQADNYSRAAASRAEAVKAEDDGDTLENIDTELFLQWLQAYNTERQTDPQASLDATGAYQPDPDTLSGFLHDRFRDDFRVAFDIWMEQSPFEHEATSKTPFELAEYQVDEWASADRFEADAEQYAAEAREANQNGDNYVLVAVVFASVMLFAGIASKMDTLPARVVLFTSAVVVLIAGSFALILMPRTF